MHSSLWKWSSACVEHQECQQAEHWGLCRGSPELFALIAESSSEQQPSNSHGCEEHRVHPGKLDPQEHLPSCFKRVSYEEHSKVQMAYPKIILTWNKRNKTWEQSPQSGIQNQELHRRQTGWHRLQLMGWVSLPCELWDKLSSEINWTVRSTAPTGCRPHSSQEEQIWVNGRHTMYVCNCMAPACVFGWVCLQMFLAHLKYPWQEAFLWIWTKPNTSLRSLLPWGHHLGTVLSTSEGSFCLFLNIFFSYLKLIQGNYNPLKEQTETLYKPDP